MLEKAKKIGLITVTIDKPITLKAISTKTALNKLVDIQEQELRGGVE